MEVREELFQLARPFADEAGYELVDVELAALGKERVLRVLLDKPGGITVGDCAAFSRRLADSLEMNQTVTGPYRLEVSSPGIERPLRTLDAVRRFAGRRAAVALRALQGDRRHFEGELISPDDGRAGIRTDAGEEVWFDWTDVRSAHLVVDPWAGRLKAGAQAAAFSRPRGGSR